MHIDRERDKEDVVYIHSGILLSHKKTKIMSSAATWMKLEIVILCTSKPDKEARTLIDWGLPVPRTVRKFICMVSSIQPMGFPS